LKKPSCFSSIYPIKALIFYRESGILQLIGELYPNDLEILLKPCMKDEQARKHYDPSLYTPIPTTISIFADVIGFNLPYTSRLENDSYILYLFFQKYKEIKVMILTDKGLKLKLFKVVLRKDLERFIRQNYNKILYLSDSIEVELEKKLKKETSRLLLKLNLKYLEIYEDDFYEDI